MMELVELKKELEMLKFFFCKNVLVGLLHHT